jgi:acyl-CoA synthetase (AMP-forming)/AMP-acid ligase II
VMSGYLGNPEATAATIDADGWLHSGDIAIRDADGYYTIVDRLKELIKYKGYQVPPAELEALLISHPEVADAAVVGVPDPECGELPKAFVVPADGELDADELMAWVSERVSPQKRIRMVEIVEEIPKSPSGKILRRVLKERSA